MRSWSVSSIRSFHACQLAWWFRRTGVPPEFTPVALVEGIVLHEALAHHLRGVRDGAVPDRGDTHELMEASWFVEESAVPIRYGRLDRATSLERLRRLFDHWFDVEPLRGEVLGVEVAVRAEFPGIELPLLGYADLVIRREDGIHVIDFKVTATKPSPDAVLDPLDLQKLALTRGLEIAGGEPVTGWAWQHLVKTKEPQVVDNAVRVTAESREADLRRLGCVVPATLLAMREVTEEGRLPIPTQAAVTMCGSCAYRPACSGWTA